MVRIDSDFFGFWNKEEIDPILENGLKKRAEISFSFDREDERPFVVNFHRHLQQKLQNVTWFEDDEVRGNHSGFHLKLFKEETEEDRKLLLRRLERSLKLPRCSTESH